MHVEYSIPLILTIPFLSKVRHGPPCPVFNPFDSLNRPSKRGVADYSDKIGAKKVTTLLPFRTKTASAKHWKELAAIETLEPFAVVAMDRGEDSGSDLKSTLPKAR